MSSSSKNYEDCHEHPLLIQWNLQRLAGGALPECSRCGEKVSAAAPYLRCAEEDCEFYLHKVCADPPSELYLPFHPDHPLLLLQDPPHSSREWICSFCDEKGDKFVYHCSCEFNFHIKCALLMEQQSLKDMLEDVALQDPLIISTTENDDQQSDDEDFSKCFVCWEPLANYTHFSPDSGFNVHERCAELPLKINHMCHQKHSLVLQLNSEQLPCKLCKVTREREFEYVYGCSPCEFVVHTECVLSPSPPLVIEDNSHPHPFTLFPRRASFICDACGTDGIYAAYICCTCNIIVHRNCTSLPPVIKSNWHDHRIFHKYFLPRVFKSSDCLICHAEVNPEHGNYCCSICDVVFHVNCVTQDKDLYSIVSHEDEDELLYESSFTVSETNDAGEATRIKHFKHMHNLLLSPFVGGYGNSCDGCMLPISDPFYYCSQCDFFLHKACAESPTKKHVWHHSCREPLILTSENLFQCEECWQMSNAFSYKCCECMKSICLQCVIALTPGAHACSKHEHPLFFFIENDRNWNTNWSTKGVFRCKEDCKFVIDRVRFSLPITACHKCDEHLLSLTYHNGNDYSGSHYCDICERGRNPNIWFYHCATCDTCAHVDCALGKYPFIKLGSMYKEGDAHPHPMTFVKKKYYYPDCEKCGRPCEDLSLECTKSGCNYIVHWGCVVPINLTVRRWSRWSLRGYQFIQSSSSLFDEY